MIPSLRTCRGCSLRPCRGSHRTAAPPFFHPALHTEHCFQHLQYSRIIFSFLQQENQSFCVSSCVLVVLTKNAYYTVGSQNNCWPIVYKQKSFFSQRHKRKQSLQRRSLKRPNCMLQLLLYQVGNTSTGTCKNTEVKQLVPRSALGWVTIQGLDVDAVDTNYVKSQKQKNNYSWSWRPSTPRQGSIFYFT